MALSPSIIFEIICDAENDKIDLIKFQFIFLFIKTIYTKAAKNKETVALYLFFGLTYIVSESIRIIKPQYN